MFPLNEKDRLLTPPLILDPGHSSLIILVDQSNIINVFKILKDEEDFAFTQLTDLCGVDLPHEEIRFQVVYNLLSMSNNSRIIVKAFTDNSNSVPSIKKIYPGDLKQKLRLG